MLDAIAIAHASERAIGMPGDVLGIERSSTVRDSSGLAKGVGLIAQYQPSWSRLAGQVPISIVAIAY
ncbi:hypothetical protein A7X75_16665 [Stenotrophomonas maltophilia]|nr:hypothetical protein A7X75_16665 [Stenotrophomonas maltophilia]